MIKLLNQAKKELIIEACNRGVENPRDFLMLKNEICERHKIDSLPNYGLRDIYNKLIETKEIEKNLEIEKLLKKAKMRTLSGVAVVSVLTKPYKCPGNCLYCPSEKNMPKSYLSNEPAVMRAILCKFDPYKQVQMRLRALEQAGHATDKIELIIMGGSFNALPLKYQYWFIERCFSACNECGMKNQKPKVKIQSFISKFKKYSIFNIQYFVNSLKSKLSKEQKRNERVKHRIIGLTLETRPDLINEKEILKFRDMGCTKVEIGVQSIYDEVLEKNKRGHGRAETIKATKLLKDAGFKVSYHMIPNLLGSNLEKDYEMFREIFTNPDFQPDLLKIYPCVVTKDSELYNIWKRGDYKPYSDEELFELLIKIKKIIPPYVRISRLIRDIPEESIVAGNKRTNLRQLIANDSRSNNWKCNCIRCREIRDSESVGTSLDLSLQLDRVDYNASGGKEIFLQYIDENNRLYSMLRLRIPVGNVDLRSLHQGLQNCAVIREVHTYGEMMSVGARHAVPEDVSQHKGLGRKLIEKAEKIARDEFGFDKIAIIAGVGAREYYRKINYELEGTYMVKSIDK